MSSDPDASPPERSALLAGRATCRAPRTSGRHSDAAHPAAATPGTTCGATSVLAQRRADGLRRGHGAVPRTARRRRQDELVAVGGCDLSNSLLPPSSEYWFGTDQLGCDVYSMTIFGARPSVMVGVISAPCVTICRGARRAHRRLLRWLGRLGALPHHRRLLRLPLIVVGIAVLSVISLPGIWGVVLVPRPSWAGSSVARMVRGQTIEAKNQDYTTAARALGASNSRIMIRHILPNAMGPAIVLAVLALGGFISAEATFSFLGLGIRPPAFSWGTIIAESQPVFFQAPWTLLFPAALPEPDRPGVHPAGRCRSARPSTRSCGGDRWRERLLDVEDLFVEFHTRDGEARAVNGCLVHPGARPDHRHPRGVRVGQVGDRPGHHGHPRHASGTDRRRLHPAAGQELIGLPEDEYRQIRGRRIAMIFQDALSALNPVMSVGDQISRDVPHPPGPRQEGRPATPRSRSCAG